VNCLEEVNPLEPSNWSLTGSIIVAENPVTSLNHPLMFAGSLLYEVKTIDRPNLYYESIQLSSSSNSSFFVSLIELLNKYVSEPGLFPPTQVVFMSCNKLAKWFRFVILASGA